MKERKISFGRSIKIKGNNKRAAHRERITGRQLERATRRFRAMASQNDKPIVIEFGHCVGSDGFTAECVAFAQMIETSSAPVISKILGRADSAAIIIARACQECFAKKGDRDRKIIFFHLPTMNLLLRLPVFDNSKKVKRIADRLLEKAMEFSAGDREKITQYIRSLFERRTDLKKREIDKILVQGTDVEYSVNAALDAGLIDGVMNGSK